MIPTTNSEDPKNYRQALETARLNLYEREFEEVANNAGANWDGEKFTLKSFNDRLMVYPRQARVLLESNHQPVIFNLRLIAINYLARASDKKLTFELVSYRELPGAESYWLAFNREAITPLLKSYQRDKKNFIDNCYQMGGIRQERKGDFNVVFWAFPKLPVTIKFWEGDEEIAGNCNILFDRATPDYLHTEDVAVLGQLIADVLVKY